MTPEIQSQKSRALCQLAPVIPVIVIKDAAHAADLARALVTGGLPVLEVTLRSDAALDSIRAMSKIEGGHVGAGTVLTPDDAKRAKDAGASFAVSPGLTDRLIQACADLELPLLPGAVTASEVMRASDAGFDMLKFFPAEAVGGAPALKSLAGPLPKVSFCPTGGVSPQNADSYLSLPNVVCVGGSWIVTDADVAAGNWQAIEDRARTAAALPRG
ncbi:bifunctional 4-hydroxy-2-oxoglutarate aldolase/2-dehydro-3-deoxy-phosphogluconate aldolase [Paracoccus indicus]|uniref:bifunctional 4-hydroxy-2-oxoglutarate aldolase/2-dehydro-3-deoxy-phosphogluconate aldolase n=1 Tax=Paracoccus indicus TaxID=2079229 RepID=UPI000D37E9F3|nr:bifunctional 4-hydroxy-2-oxoglutarate aldolase/2-dehydro-3-deoxy-phosphogluconate aldolase [Paracoccus indicus]